MSDDDNRRIFRQPLNYENGVLLPLIRDIAYWRVMDENAYRKGIQTLMLLLPDVLRTDAMGHWRHGTMHDDLSKESKKEFDEIYSYILKLLEDNNICFPKISYEIGHD